MTQLVRSPTSLHYPESPLPTNRNLNAAIELLGRQFPLTDKIPEPYGISRITAKSRRTDERLKRIKDAVTLETMDKIPFIPCGTAFNAKACGVKRYDYLKSMSYDCTVNIKAAGIIGGIEGIQFPIYSAEVLPLIWLCEVEVPGRSKDMSRQRGLAGYREGTCEGGRL